MKSLTPSFSTGRITRAAIFVGILAIIGLIPTSVLSQENPVPIETSPESTSAAVGDIAITEPDPAPPAVDATETVSDVIAEVQPASTKSAAADLEGATSSAISLVLTDGEDVTIAESGERIVLEVERDEPLVKVDDKAREFPAVEKRDGRVYLVLPSSGQNSDSLNLAAPISTEPVAESEPVESP